MQKLTLDLETVRVESFATAATEADIRGTVQGREYGIVPSPTLQFTFCRTDCSCPNTQ